MATKLVDGVRVELTAEEEAALVAEWGSPTAVVPASISKAQLKYATQNIEHAPGVTLWDAIKAALAQSGADTQETWDLIHVLPRNHPLVVAMAQALGKSDADMDAVWTAGAQL